MQTSLPPVAPAGAAGAFFSGEIAWRRRFVGAGLVGETAPGLFISAEVGGTFCAGGILGEESTRFFFSSPHNRRGLVSSRNGNSIDTGDHHTIGRNLFWIVLFFVISPAQCAEEDDLEMAPEHFALFSRLLTLCISSPSVEVRRTYCLVGASNSPVGATSHPGALLDPQTRDASAGLILSC